MLIAAEGVTLLPLFSVGEDKLFSTSENLQKKHKTNDRLYGKLTIPTPLVGNSGMEERSLQIKSQQGIEESLQTQEEAKKSITKRPPRKRRSN